MKVSLAVTHDCNLRCRYCYAGEKFKKSMDLETAKKIVDFAFRNLKKEEEINFSFFGGEPLLRLSLIKEIISYIESRGFLNPVTYNITTNGTLINDEILEFVKEKRIRLCVSIDGPSFIHDKNRVDKNERGTLALIMKNMKKVREKLDFYQVNAVFSPGNVTYLKDIVEFFLDNGIRNIHLNPNINAKWPKEIFSVISKSYKDVADIYIREYKENRALSINMIDSKVILFFKGGYGKEDRCSMGEREFGFAPSGNVYPCERLIGDDSNEELRMGNIHTGINPFIRCKIASKSSMKKSECLSCELRDYCMHWCGCTNYNMTGDVDRVSNMLCHSEKSAIAAAKYVFQNLKNSSSFIEHILGYMEGEGGMGIFIEEVCHE